MRQATEIEVDVAAHTDVVPIPLIQFVLREREDSVVLSSPASFILRTSPTGHPDHLDA